MAGNFKSVAAGNKYAYLGFYDTEGRFIGGNTSAPSAGAAGSGMYRILGIKSAPVVVPENDTQQSTGDDTCWQISPLPVSPHAPFRLRSPCKTSRLNSG